MELTATDQDQIAAKGIAMQQVELQVANFRNGFPFVQLDRPAIAGDGIVQLSEEEVKHFATEYEQTNVEVVKFVPASGAASRMFKHIHALLEGESSPLADDFLARVTDFAFYNKLQAIAGNSEPHQLAKVMLSQDGLNYGNSPKALIEFHLYEDSARTSLEEHLVESTHYSNSSIHLTVSPEHLERIKEEVAATFGKYGKIFQVTYSIQKPATDTIAVDMENQPFRQENGEILFRPAGHGALLENLNDLDADIIFVKNIDNILPDNRKEDTIVYKKALGGLLLQLKQQAHSYLQEMQEGEIDESKLMEIAAFTQESLNAHLAEYTISGIRAALDRPIRVCGMVRNEGEPGGGPFWVKNERGLSLQIVEKAEIDTDNPSQQKILDSATHFNPVDLVCAVKDYRNEKFNLLDFRDSNTGFISIKSQAGRDLKAQELPGLWNGAMAYWNTVFVEVPITTFNPVKTINDLLKPEHQPG